MGKKKQIQIQPARNRVSIVTCTNRPGFIDNVFQNYSNQTGIQKELIIVLNNNRMSVDHYRKRAKTYKNVFIYKLPQKYSLGKCLNFGISKTRYPFIAKFDDDDYYAPNYLASSLKALHRRKADVVGKRSYFMYIEGKNILLLRRPNHENRFVKYVGGATLLAKRKVFTKVKFEDRSLREDMKFCQDCTAKGFKIFSTNKYNYTAIRRKDPNSHTWKASNAELFSLGKIIARTRNYRPLVTR